MVEDQFFESLNISLIHNSIQQYLQTFVHDYGWITTKENLEKRLNEYLEHILYDTVGYEAKIEDSEPTWLEEVFGKDPKILSFDVIIKKINFNKTARFRIFMEI